MADPFPITKQLFEAGMQCAKRLYLEHHLIENPAARTAHQEELFALGRRLVELASQAFPRGLDLADAEFDEAVRRTREFVDRGAPGVLFHAAFRGGGAEVRTDVLLLAGKGEMDVFEIKAGTSVKPRHLYDVAMQLHVIESCGYEVKSASLLHLDPRYVHDGTPDYPVQKLFKSVDVTTRARNQLARVRDRIASFQPILEDEGTLELPTGTWCKNPLPCSFLPRCTAEGPPAPLVELPQLNPMQERRFHEAAIESIQQLDPAQPGLTAVQRRVVHAVDGERLIVEPFVPRELHDVDWPLAFVHVSWHLDALPRFARSRPWQKAPFAWSSHRVEKSGRVYCRSFVSATAEDPRPPALRSLAEEIAEAGTLFVYGRGFDERLHVLLDDLGDLKSELRTLLNAPLLELGNLIFHGAYHPAIRNDFGQPQVYDVLSGVLGSSDEESIEGLADPRDLEIATEAQAEDAYRRILAKRTRSTTRDKLGQQIDAYVRHSSASLLRLYRLLAAVPPPGAGEADPTAQA